MPRLLGVEIPADKRVEVSLTYIYGIGFSTARRILEQTNIDPNIRAKDLTPQQLNEIIHAITNNKVKIEGDLRRDVQSKRKNNPRLRPERPKLFRSQPKRLTSQRLLRPKEARTFIQALRMCLLRLTTPSSRSPT